MQVFFLRKKKTNVQKKVRKVKRVKKVEEVEKKVEEVEKKKRRKEKSKSKKKVFFFQKLPLLLHKKKGVMKGIEG